MRGIQSKKHKLGTYKFDKILMIIKKDCNKLTLVAL